MKQITIVMYHFVRELQYTRYPKIKGLLTSQFKEQLTYIEKHYQFVTIEDCINAIYLENFENFPSNAILLTFDDAYIDQFITVFPLLEEKGIQGCFFPPAKAILKHEVLDVNKIHFLLASVSNIHDLLHDLYICLDKYRSEYSLENNDYYFSKLAIANRFDPKEVIFIKRLLQVELEEKLRNLIVNELFKKYVTNDEQAFSRELYMDIEQLKCMARNGMYIGSHGYDHYWLNTLSPEKQEKEIDLSLEFLKEVGSPTDNWVMCYPYGAYNSSLIDILKKKRCMFALTTKVDIACLNKDNAFTLERLDTNDLPKVASAEANLWTKKALNSKRK
ncbi:MAG: polysaccharide deacetylase family protein [Candidatus Thermoplasmatota archaeon]|nr:polysaccharide deacetylase family protein [Candidatus Thermoplasmatota archaeon]